MKYLELIKLNFKIYKKNIVLWGVILVLIMFLYMYLFSYVQDIANAKIESMPSEILQLFNMNDLSDMNNFLSYFNVINSMLIIALSVFAINFCSSAITDEEKNGTINFLINQNIGRKHIYFSKIILSYLVILIISLTLNVSAISAGLISIGNINTLSVIKSGLISSIIPLFFISLASLFSGFSKENSKAITFSIMFTIYILGYLGSLLENNLLINLSIFNTLSINNLNITFYIMMYSFLIILFTSLGYIFYKKRDFKI